MDYSPLRYPGGKAKLATYIKSIFEQNDLCDGHYVEPYAGGSAVALELLMLEYATHIHINDLDPAIHSFWFSVLEHTEGLCRRIQDTPVNMEQWLLQKQVINSPPECPILDRGFATFFLNRTNRSGILKGGVIGGKSQTGKWKLDVRYNKENLIKRIKKIAMYRDRISLYNEDASVLLKRLQPVFPKNTLLYLDPPYYLKGKGLYRNYYTHQDHVNIEKRLKLINNVKWMVSYDNAKEIRDIYSRYNQKIYSFSYTAQTKTLGTEVIIYGPGLKHNLDEVPYRPQRRRRSKEALLSL